MLDALAPADRLQDLLDLGGPVTRARTVIGWPMISSREYPYMRSAAGFQLVITPSTVLPTMASSQELTIADSRADSGKPRTALILPSDNWSTTAPPDAGRKREIQELCPTANDTTKDLLPPQYHTPGAALPNYAGAGSSDEENTGR